MKRRTIDGVSSDVHIWAELHDDNTVTIGYTDWRQNGINTELSDRLFITVPLDKLKAAILA